MDTWADESLGTVNLINGGTWSIQKGFSTRGQMSFGKGSKADIQGLDLKDQRGPLLAQGHTFLRAIKSLGAKKRDIVLGQAGTVSTGSVKTGEAKPDTSVSADAVPDKESTLILMENGKLTRSSTPSDVIGLVYGDNEVFSLGTVTSYGTLGLSNGTYTIDTFNNQGFIRCWGSVRLEWVN